MRAILLESTILPFFADSLRHARKVRLNPNPNPDPDPSPDLRHGLRQLEGLVDLLVGVAPARAKLRVIGLG